MTPKFCVIIIREPVLSGSAGESPPSLRSGGSICTRSKGPIE